MNETATSPAVAVCPSEALVDGGLCRKIPVRDGAGQTTALFVRYQGKAYGYLNRCAHVGVEIDWEGSVFTRDGTKLMCARHGATYEPDTGICNGGLSRGGRLAALQVEERDTPEGRQVFWLPAGKVQPLD